MSSLAKQLTPTGWVLRSGHADGSDNAFEQGAGRKQIFLPWEGYNGAHSNGIDTGHLRITPQQELIANTAYMAQKDDHQPPWTRLIGATRALFCRNVPVILGETLAAPSEMVITWFDPNNYKGGTRHALQIARMFNVRVFNIWEAKDQSNLCKFVWDIENS